MNKKIKLSDERYFKLFIGKRVLKKDIYLNEQTKIPLFSANVIKTMGYVNKTNINDFQYNNVLWGIDGNFEFNVIEKNKIFATTDHCGTVQILNHKINPYFLEYQLKIQGKLLGYDRSLRSNIKNIKKIEIEIPINEDENFDLIRQKEILKKIKLIKKTKNQIKIILERLNKTTVVFNEKHKIEKNHVGKYFITEKTNTGMTKTFCFNNKGNIPVYAASKLESHKLGSIKDNLENVKYYNDSLSWNRNGFVGKFFVRKGRFSTNEDHYVLAIKKEYKNKLDLNYVKYYLEENIKSLKHDFTFKLGKKRLEEFHIEFPINSNGEICLKTQKTLSKKYIKLETFRNNLENKLKNILELEVKF